MLRITCYGGVNEIGGNKILLEDGGSALMLDFGKRMGAVNSFFDDFLRPRTHSCLRDLLSLGLVPEIPGIYRHDLLQHAGVWDRLSGSGIPEHARRLFTSELESYDDYKSRTDRAPIDGILLSHAHADHVQDLCFVDPRIPVYCSHVTLAILQAAEDIGRSGVESEVCVTKQRIISETKSKSTFPGCLDIDSKSTSAEREMCVIEPGAVFEVGRFNVEPVPVDHSVPGAYAYLIKCPSGKVVFYTGDLRFHGVCAEITSRLRERVAGLRPDVFITEGTRVVDRNGKEITAAGDNEAHVEREITEIVRACDGLAIVDFGWKDTTRFQTIARVAQATGRVLAVSSKVAYLWSKLRRIDPDTYPEFSHGGCVRVYLERIDSMTYSPADYTNAKHAVGLCVDWGASSQDMRKAFADGDEDYLNERLCHYRHGVRAYDIAADPRKFILHAGFFDMNELFDVAPPPGSVFVSAVTEPFCDEMDIDQKKLKNWLDHFGIDYGGDEIEHHHVSGHANGEDLLDFIRSAEPKLVIPVHTEHPAAFVDKLEGITVRPPELGSPLSCP